MKTKYNSSLYIGTIFSVLVIVFLFYFKSKLPDAPAKPEESTASVASVSREDGRYDYFEIPAGAASEGPLILVNLDFPYVFPEDAGIVSVLENKSDAYYVQVQNRSVSVQKSVMPALDKMLAAFTKQSPKNQLNIVSGYRNYDKQDSLFETRKAQSGETEAKRWVAVPGKSEHHTGYALDLGIYSSKTGTGTYDGTGIYAWLNENAPQYGFVVRYAQDKEAVTGVAYEPWHFRYVSVPHAYEMVSRNLSLEEYIDFLMEYPFEGDHLLARDANGGEYEIYTVKAEPEGPSRIPVPREEDYEISGTNTGFFVVTIPLL